MRIFLPRAARPVHAQRDFAMTLAFTSLYSKTAKIKYRTRRADGAEIRALIIGAPSAPTPSAAVELLASNSTSVKATETVPVPGEVEPSTISDKGEHVRRELLAHVRSFHVPAANGNGKGKRRAVPAPIANRVDAPAPSVNGPMK